MGSYNKEIINAVFRVTQQYENDKIIFNSPNLLRLNDEGIIIVLNFNFLQGNRDWLVGFSDEFNKSMKKYKDKKLMGRVLEAIQKIVENPMIEVGDTIKPLTENLEGKWRYRIGDYRLLYEPKISERKIIIITLATREEVYE